MTPSLPTRGLLLIFTTAFLSDICRGQDWSGLSGDMREKVRAMQQASLSWLDGQMNKDFGWDDGDGDTARAVLALAVAQDGWLAEKDLRARLSAKRLEIELLEKLMRHEIEPVTPAIISVYALALNAICKDPRHFYGYNLIASLERHSSDEDYPGYSVSFGFGLTSLISCLGGSHSHKHQVRRLLQAANDQGYSIVTRSMALQALECFKRKRHSETLVGKISQAAESLARLQEEDGTFGNIQKTSMAVQGLAAVGTGSWNRTAAVMAMFRYQNPDGSYIGSIHATSDALISLTSLLDGSGLLSLKRGDCTDFRTTPSNNGSHPEEQGGKDNNDDDGHDDMASSSTSGRIAEDDVGSVAVDSQVITTPLVLPTAAKQSARMELALSTSQLASSSSSSVPPPTTTITITSSAESSRSSSSAFFPSSSMSLPTSSASSSLLTPSPSPSLPLIQVKFWLWIGPDPKEAERANITLLVPLNSTFYTVMRRAAEKDPQYQFGASVWPNGHYVHTLSGRREQPEAYHYWLLYKLPRDPKPESPPPTTYVTPAGVDNLIVHDEDIYLYWYKKI